MASFAIEKAIVAYVSPVLQVSESFRKRELIITIDNDTQYVQTIKIEAAQDKVDDPNLLECRIGDEITIDINLRGRSWTNPKDGKNEVFNTLQFWKLAINRTTAGNNTQQNQGNFVPQGPPTSYPPQHQYQQPQGQPAQQYQQAPQQGQPIQGNQPAYQPHNQAPQYAQPVQTQQTQMQPQPVQQQQWADPNQQQQSGYTTLPNPGDLPF